MRKKLLFILLAFTLTYVGMAQDTIYRPRFLVANQLIPYAIKLQTDVSASQSYMTTPEGDQDLKTSSLMFDSYLLPAVANEKNLVIFGVGYMGDRFSTNQLNIDNYYQGTYLNLFATGSLTKKCFWITYQSVGLFSDNMFDETSDNLKYFQFTKFGYKWNANFATSLGFLYISNFGNPVTIPLLSLSYSTNKFIINAELPAKMEIEFLASQKLRIIADGAFSAKSYFGKTVDNSLYYTENKASVGLKYNALKYTWVYLGVTKMFSNEFKWQNPDSNIGKLENDYRISVGIFVHIE